MKKFGWKIFGRVLLKILGKLGLVFAGIIGIILFTLAVFVIKYRQWEGEEASSLDEMIDLELIRDVESLDDSLSTFQSSLIEKETLRLSKTEIEALILRAVENNGGEIEGLGVVLRNRSFDVYVKSFNYPWIIIRIWQRQSGFPDFVVYDVKFGSVSLGNLSWGWVNSQYSAGMQEALDMVLSDSFSGRKISEFYLFENGIRIVGVLEDDVDSE